MFLSNFKSSLQYQHVAKYPQINRKMHKILHFWIELGGAPGKLLACCILWNPRNTNYYDCQMFWIIFYHQNEVMSVVSEMLESTIEWILWNERQKFWHSSPRWWEVSDPLHNNSIHRLCTRPYHNPVKKSWLFLSWLVEFEIRFYFSAVLFQGNQPFTENPANHLLITVCTF